MVSIEAGAVQMSALAETGGHFLSEVEEPTVKGTESTTHSTELVIPGLNGIVCEEAFYEAKPPKSEAKTWTEVTVTPKYGKCKTTGGTAGQVGVDLNGCAYVFKIGKLALQDNTVDLECKGEKAEIVLTHEGCEIAIPAQSGLLGVAYKPISEGGKAALTAEVTVTKISAQFHSGFCVLLGTNHNGELKGSVVVTGSSGGVPAGILAEGSEDPVFHSEVGHWAITGSTTSSTLTFGELIGSVKCTSATFDGTSASQETGVITVKPAYSGCEGLKRVVTTHMNGCAYVLRVTGKEGSDGLVEIECPSGASIETTFDKFPEGCTLTVGAQTAGGIVDYKEEGAGTGRKLALTWTLTGIKYKRDGCEVNGEGNNGTMTDGVTLEGEDTSGNPKGFWIE